MNDSKLHSIRDDLRFVRDAVERSDQRPASLLSRILWSTYCLVGFVLLDFRPEIGGLFLLIGLPVAGLIEWLAAIWGHRKQQQRMTSTDSREFLQLLAFILAVGVVVVLAFRGHLSNGYSLGQMILVLVGFYFSSVGIWAPARLRVGWNAPLVLGLCLMGSAILVSFFSRGVWTALGVLQASIIGFGWRFPMTPIGESSSDSVAS